MSQLLPCENEHDFGEVLIVQCAVVDTHADVMRNLMQHDRFSHCPYVISRNRNDSCFYFVMRSGSPLAMSYAWRRNSLKFAHVDNIRLDIIEASETDLNRRNQL